MYGYLYNHTGSQNNVTRALSKYWSRILSHSPAHFSKMAFNYPGRRHVIAWVNSNFPRNAKIWFRLQFQMTDQTGGVAEEGHERIRAQSVKKRNWVIFPRQGSFFRGIFFFGVKTEKHCFTNESFCSCLISKPNHLVIRVYPFVLMLMILKPQSRLCI